MTEICIMTQERVKCLESLLMLVNYFFDSCFQVGYFNTTQTPPEPVLCFLCLPLSLLNIWYPGIAIVALSSN